MLIYEKKSTVGKEKRLRQLFKYVIIGITLASFLTALWLSIIYNPIKENKYLGKSHFKSKYIGDVSWKDTHGNMIDNCILELRFKNIKETSKIITFECEVNISKIQINVRSKGKIDLSDHNITFESEILSKNLGKGRIKKIDNQNLTITALNNQWTLHNE